MKPLKFVRVELRKPRSDPNPEKSKTNNSSWRQGLFIIFEDYQGNIYDYMPKWSEVTEINEGRKKIEEVNSNLAKLVFKEKWH